MKKFGRHFHRDRVEARLRFCLATGDATARSLRSLMSIMPPRLRHGPSAQAYQLIARAERARAQAGKGIVQQLGAPSKR